MSLSVSALTSQLNVCNDRLYQSISSEQIDSANQLLQQRGRLIEQLIQQMLHCTDSERECCQAVLQQALVDDAPYILLAEQQRSDTFEQFKKFKSAKKALPAYQANY